VKVYAIILDKGVRTDIAPIGIFTLHLDVDVAMAAAARAERDYALKVRVVEMEASEVL
jgi:hypothetical protein